MKTAKLSFNHEKTAIQEVEIHTEDDIREAIQLALQSSELQRGVSFRKNYYSALKTIYPDGINPVMETTTPYIYRSENLSPASVVLKIGDEVVAETDAQNFEDFHQLVGYIRDWLKAEIPVVDGGNQQAA